MTWPSQPPTRTRPEPPAEPELGWPHILAMFVGASGMLFAASVAWWWVAHLVAWWVYGLASVAWLWAWVSVKQWRKSRKARRP